MLYDKKHIYVRSPMRVSFVGGGTDLESYYLQGKSGHVVSAAIDLFCYVAIKDMFDANVRVHHAEIETESIASRIKHPYSRVALEHYGMFKGAEVVLTSDVMTTGSGLGASSSMMSALIVGCHEMRGHPRLDKSALAELTYALEKDAGTIGGRQDQYAAAFGGLNAMDFTAQGVNVRPVRISGPKLEELQSRIFLVFTNIARESRMIQMNLAENSRSGEGKHFEELRNLSLAFLEELESPKTDFRTLGRMLHDGWELKKASSSGSTNPYIEQLYETLKKRGVIGGKILGAGGGGFFLAFAGDPSIKEKVKYDLYPNFISLDVDIAPAGTEILWKNF